MNVLVGDTNEDKRVNVGDTNQTKGRSGQTTDSTNLRSDVNLDGTINVGGYQLRERSLRIQPSLRAWKRR